MFFLLLQYILVLLNLIRMQPYAWQFGLSIRVRRYIAYGARGLFGEYAIFIRHKRTHTIFYTCIGVHIYAHIVFDQREI